MNKKVFAVLFIITVVIEIFLLSAGVSMIAAAIIVFAVLLGGYTGWWTWANKRLIKILDQLCDPEKFIEKCEKFKKISKRPAFQKHCNVNIAAGLITLGRNEEALDILLNAVDSGIKSSHLLETACRLNIFVCRLNLGDIDKAGEEYEKHIKALRVKTVIYKLAYSIDESVAYYLYLKYKTPETAKLFLEQLDYIGNIHAKHNNKRQKLELIFRKAETLYELNDLESAVKKYTAIAENGGGLWVAEASKRRLEGIET